MSNELYLHSEKKSVLTSLDEEITVQTDILRSLRFKNDRTDQKVNTNEQVKQLIAMMAEIEILKAKKAQADNFCDENYSMNRYDPY